MTVNQLLELMKVVKERVGRYKAIQKDIVIKEKYSERITGDFVRETQFQYDPKAIDKRISDYEKFLFRASSAIKESNARTEVKMEEDVNSLLDPL